MPGKKHSRAGGGGGNRTRDLPCVRRTQYHCATPLATRDCDCMPTKHWSLVGIAFPLELSGKDTSYINLRYLSVLH